MAEISKKENVSAQSKNVRYWLYAPGEQASLWDTCINNEVMCVGWHMLGNLRQYKGREDIVKALQSHYNNPDASYMNDSLSLWNFINEIKVGDVVYAKTSIHTILGRGVVKSDYDFDSSIATNYPNIRRIEWTCADASHTQVSKYLVQKTLTDITNDKAFLSELDALFETRNLKQYWWLVANSSIWDMRTAWKEGFGEDFTIFNENGRRRKLSRNFDDAQVGDIVVGYETVTEKYKNIYESPMIVALGIVDKASDGEVIWFKCEKQLQNPVYLSFNEMKQNPNLKDMEYVRNSRGTLFKLKESEYCYLMDMIREKNPNLNLDVSKVMIKEDPTNVYVTKNLYSKQDFLSEVYMSEDDYDSLRYLLETKKNVILQGAPGVGKTFAAKRLAYSIMGEKDNNRVEFIQFHQNYSYEDFMMGYKPTEEGGFAIKEGTFYNFCQKAMGDIEHEYFFIIDEINRGNLSKIFGEVMMLMENDYRGESVKLAYRDELFSIPKNVYIIGMMNTADRSLAMMDYALRRRFSFFEMQPAFESEGFRKYQNKLDCKVFNEVIDEIVGLNKRIADDDSLGRGFCIGHSYFCNQEVVNINWLRNVVKYDIEPMLREYWFDDDKKYQSEIENLNKLF